MHGKGGGRREAARALAAFPGAAANALAMKFLYDPDPHVQAAIVGQLRGRGIPGILPELVKMVDSPHAVVRKAARESLSEFSFRRYLAAFEMLDEEVRQNTGMLVRKIDPQTVPLLREELHSPMRTRRLRAMAIARLIDVVEPLEPIILELLEDADHMVRTAAAAALARSHSAASHQALLRRLARQERSRAAGGPAKPPGAGPDRAAGRTLGFAGVNRMHNLFSQCLLLAERSRLDNLSEPFKRPSAGMDPGEVTRALAILAVIIVSAWLLLRLRTAQERRRPYDSPLRLFLALCKAHNLRWSERWLLWRLARAQRLKEPARLFLEPQRFDAAGSGPALAGRAARLRRIRDQLFSDPPRAAKEEQGQPRRQTKPGGVVAVAVAVAGAPLWPKRPGPAVDIAPWPAEPLAPDAR